MRTAVRAEVIASFVIALALGASGVARGEVIDDFDAAGAPAGWTFSNGAEFPGATGGMALAEGHSGRGARLSFAFAGEGRYVAMSRALTGVPADRALALWFRADPRVHLVLRLTDSAGQTVQYDLGRSFESIAPGWTQVVFPDVASANDHWGGANDGVLRGDLTSLSIMVVRSPLAPLQGAIDVDDVTAIVARDHATLDPFAAGFALDPAAAELAPRLGVTVHDPGSTQTLDAMAAAGFTWIRTDLFWSWVEARAGVYDFATFDAALAAIEARGMRALFVLDYGNPLYGEGPPIERAAITAFGRYARAAAAHFAGRPVVFEVWNEPDSDRFWPPGNKPLQYAPLLTEAVARLREGDPRAVISTGGVSWFFWDYFDAFLAAFVGTGAAAGADHVAVHAYGSDPPENAVGNLVELRAIVAARISPAPPVIGSEWGFSSFAFSADPAAPDGRRPAARARQAVYAVRAQLASWVAGLPIAIWYDGRDDCDDGADNECNFGLLTTDGAAKPALTAIQTLSDVARGRRLTSLLSEAVGPRALRLEGESDLVVIAWASRRGAVTELVVPAPDAATDLHGAEIAWTAAPDGKATVTLREVDGPVYLRYRKPGGSGPDAGPPDAGVTGPAGRDAGGPAAGGGLVRGGCNCSTPGGPSSTVSIALALLLGGLGGRRRPGNFRANGRCSKRWPTTEKPWWSAGS